MSFAVRDFLLAVSSLSPTTIYWQDAIPGCSSACRGERAWESGEHKEPFSFSLSGCVFLICARWKSQDSYCEKLAYLYENCLTAMANIQKCCGLTDCGAASLHFLQRKRKARQMGSCPIMDALMLATSASLWLEHKAVAKVQPLALMKRCSVIYQCYWFITVYLLRLHQLISTIISERLTSYCVLFAGPAALEIPCPVHNGSS